MQKPHALTENCAGVWQTEIHEVGSPQLLIKIQNGTQL